MVGLTLAAKEDMELRTDVELLSALGGLLRTEFRDLIGRDDRKDAYIIPNMPFWQ